MKTKQDYIKYGRKNSLRCLEILMEHISGDELDTAKSAYDHLDKCLRRERIKGIKINK